MRRLIFGLVVAAAVAACATAALTGTSGASPGAAAARHNSNNVEWTQHGGDPNERCPIFTVHEILRSVTLEIILA